MYRACFDRFHRQVVSFRAAHNARTHSQLYALPGLMKLDRLGCGRGFAKSAVSSQTKAQKKGAKDVRPKVVVISKQFSFQIETIYQNSYCTTVVHRCSAALCICPPHITRATAWKNRHVSVGNFAQRWVQSQLNCSYGDPSTNQ